MVVFQQFFQLRLVALAAVPQGLRHISGLGLFVQHLVQADHGGVAAGAELSVFVKHIGHTAAHAGGKVASRAAQHHHGAAGHVLATVVACAFHDRGGTRQAHRKTLTGHAAEKRLAAGRAIKHGVAHDDVVRGFATEIDAGSHHHTPTRQTFAGVVVGVANQIQGDALGQESAKGLTTGALQLDAQGVVRQAFGAHLGERTRQHRTDRAVDVASHFHELHLLALVDGGAAFLDQHLVQRFVQTVVLGVHMEQGGAGGHLRLRQQAGEVQATGFPMLDAFFHVQQIAAANQIIELGNAQLRHDVAHFFGDKEEIVHHMLGLARELLAQRGVLGGDTHGAGVQVAFAHHDAALDHQGRGGEAKLIGSQQSTNRHIAAGFHLTVGLHPNAATQTVHHQGLLGFGQTDFPRRSRVFDGRPRRGTGAAVVTGDHHMVGLALGHARGNCAHAHLGHQLHADVGMGCDVFQVVDQLRQIFNGINVMVRRR